MQLHKGSVEFLGGFTHHSQLKHWQHLKIPRIAFAGRSNVGKSSLLNALVGHSVARVSRTPGKTQEMNCFRWNPSGKKKEDWILVDLPGYGYAKVQKTLQTEWGKFIQEWMEKEERLANVFCLIDGRHGFSDKDLQLIDFLKKKQISFTVAFTKMDAWKSNNQKKEAEKKLRLICESLNMHYPIFTSAQGKSGLDELMHFLKALHAEWKRSPQGR